MEKPFLSSSSYIGGTFRFLMAYADLVHAGFTGTPLPHPNKPDRKGTWSAQTASTLVNLARRNPLGAKPSPGPSDLPTSPRAHNGLADSKEVGNQGPGRPSAGIAKSDSPPSTPPPLPKRRQRPSLKEPITNASREEIFVVEAPEQNSPSSPLPDDQFPNEQTQQVAE
jgi:hypothetical protein